MLHVWFERKDAAQDKDCYIKKLKLFLLHCTFCTLTFVTLFSNWQLPSFSFETVGLLVYYIFIIIIILTPFFIIWDIYIYIYKGYFWKLTFEIGCKRKWAGCRKKIRVVREMEKNVLGRVSSRNMNPKYIWPER